MAKKLNRIEREELNRESLYTQRMQETWNNDTKSNSVEYPEYASGKYNEYLGSDYEEPEQSWVAVSYPWVITVYLDKWEVVEVDGAGAYKVVNLSELREKILFQVGMEFPFTKDMARHNKTKYFDLIGTNCKITWVKEWVLELWEFSIEEKYVRDNLPKEFLLPNF